MILTGLLLLVIFVILFVIAVKGFIRLPAPGKRGVVLFLIVGIASIVVIIALKGFMPLPIGSRHLMHLVSPPRDLYKPIIIDNFLFYEKGFSRTYSLQPKYLDIYEIGFFSDKKVILSSYKFQGKLKVEFFYKDKFLFEKIVTSYKAAWLANGDSDHFKEISLLAFEMPLLGKYKNDVSIKIAVLEPDIQLEAFKNSVKLYISVSAIP